MARLPVAIIQSWYQRQGYIKSMANLIEEELQKFPEAYEVHYFLTLCFLHDYSALVVATVLSVSLGFSLFFSKRVFVVTIDAIINYKTLFLGTSR